MRSARTQSSILRIQHKEDSGKGKIFVQEQTDRFAVLYQHLPPRVFPVNHPYVTSCEQGINSDGTCYHRTGNRFLYLSSSGC